MHNEELNAAIKRDMQDLFLTVGTDGAVTGLSTFGGVTAIFGGIGLAVYLTTLIFNRIRP